MCVNEREASGIVRLQGLAVVKVHETKYLESTVQRHGECGKVRNSSTVAVKVEGKVYKRVMRPKLFSVWRCWH